MCIHAIIFKYTCAVYQARPGKEKYNKIKKVIMISKNCWLNNYTVVVHLIYLYMEFHWLVWNHTMLLVSALWAFLILSLLCYWWSACLDISHGYITDDTYCW